MSSRRLGTADPAHPSRRRAQVPLSVVRRRVPTRDRSSVAHLSSQTRTRAARAAAAGGRRPRSQTQETACRSCARSEPSWRTSPRRPVCGAGGVWAAARGAAFRWLATAARRRRAAIRVLEGGRAFPEGLVLGDRGEQPDPCPRRSMTPPLRLREGQPICLSHSVTTRGRSG